MLQSTRARLLAPFPERCIEAPLPGCRRDRHGFARVSLWHQGRTITLSAHRLAFELFVAPAQPGEPVRHTRGNPACVNPCHLVSGEFAPSRRRVWTATPATSTNSQNNPMAQCAANSTSATKKMPTKAGTKFRKGHMETSYRADPPAPTFRKGVRHG